MVYCDQEEVVHAWTFSARTRFWIGQALFAPAVNGATRRQESRMGQVIREAFAQWLRTQLRSNGWMVSDFAQQVGVRPSAVYRWTAGQRTPTDGQIDKIAATLGVGSDVIWNELAREGIVPIAATAGPKEA